MSASPDALRPDPGTYRVLRAGDEEILRQYVTGVSKYEVIALDTETTGLGWAGDDRTVGDVTVGYCLSPSYGYGFYIPFGHRHPHMGLYPGQMAQEDVSSILSPLLCGAAGPQVVFHYALFDLPMLWKDGIVLDYRRVQDTSIMAKVVSFATGRWDPKGGEEGSRGLKALTKDLLGHEAVALEEISEDPGAFSTLDPFEDRVYSYAAADASNTLGIYGKLGALLKQFRLEEPYEIERLVTVPVAAMRRAGVLIDIEQCKAKQAEGEQAEAEITKQFLANLGREMGRDVSDVNLASPAQLAKVLYDPKPDGLGLPVYATSAKTGAPSTAAKVLKALANDHPIVRELLSYRKLTKNLSAFLAKLPTHADANGRVHAGLNPLGAETSRFTCSEPNLQQLPREGVAYIIAGVEYVANTRDVIVSRPGYYLFDADFDQVEYRAMAGEAHEVSLIEAFNRGEDIHRRTAALIYSIPYADITKKQRTDGKTNNFALLFGRGTEALAEALGITFEDAQRLREDYFAKLPAIARWREDVALEAQRVGYVVTRYGWRRHLSAFEGNSHMQRGLGRRQAVNTKIQGSCAGLMKIALVRCWRDIQRSPYRGRIFMVLTVHDSILFEVHDSVPIEEANALIRGAMGIEVPGWPKVTVSCSAGYRYGSLVEYTEGFVMPARDVTTDLDIESVVALSGDGATDDGADGEPSVRRARPLVLTAAAFTADQLDAFQGLLDANPGDTEIVVVLNGYRQPLKQRTSLTPDSYQWSVLGLVGIAYEDDPADSLDEVEF